MTTIGEASEAAYERWKANTTLSAAQYCFDNEPFKPPTNSAWARFSIRQMPGTTATLGAPGSRRYTRRARVFVQLYDQPSAGRANLDVLANQVLTIFEGVRFSGLRFFAADPVREGPSDGKWTQFVVTVPFDYIETK